MRARRVLRARRTSQHTRAPLRRPQGGIRRRRWPTSRLTPRLSVAQKPLVAVARVQDGKLFLYTAKTGQEVYVPVLEMVVKALDECPRVRERFWFWTGRGTVETARKKWSEALAKIFRDAKLKDGHAHRFRDTFAVELLKAGTPIENVAAFLGHASVRVTQKHYSAWVKARQVRAEADVMASWESDPVLAMAKPTKGTLQVHGKRDAVN